MIVAPPSLGPVLGEMDRSVGAAAEGCYFLFQNRNRPLLTFIRRGNDVPFATNIQYQGEKSRKSARKKHLSEFSEESNISARAGEWVEYR